MQDLDERLHSPLPSSWLDDGVAREAARAWSQVLKESTVLPSAIWYLHVAACESRMFVHAGRPAGDDHVGTGESPPREQV